MENIIIVGGILYVAYHYLQTQAAPGPPVTHSTPSVAIDSSLPTPPYVGKPWPAVGYGGDDDPTPRRYGGNSLVGWYGDPHFGHFGPNYDPSPLYHSFGGGPIGGGSAPPSYRDQYPLPPGVIVVPVEKE